MKSSPWRITDGQVHVWAAPTPERPWRAGNEVKPQREVPFGVDDLRAEMDRAGVHRAILVPPTWEGPRNDLALAAAQAEPNRFAVIGRLDPELPWTAAALAEWARAPGMLGVRLSINRGDQRGQLARAEQNGFFAAAQEIGLPITMFVPGIVPEVGAMAARHPKLRIIIDHLGLDESDQGGDLAALTAPLHPLAAQDNVAVKLSALPCFVADPPGFDRIAPIVHAMVDSFGAERCFWGSDLSRLPCDYADLVDFFADGLPGLDQRQRALILGEGISQWLGWADAHAPAPASSTFRT